MQIKVRATYFTNLHFTTKPIKSLAISNNKYTFFKLMQAIDILN